MANDLLLVIRLAAGILRLCGIEMSDPQRGVLAREMVILRVVERMPVMVLSHPGRILASTVLLVDCASIRHTRVNKLRENNIGEIYIYITGLFSERFLFDRSRE